MAHRPGHHGVYDWTASSAVESSHHRDTSPLPFTIDVQGDQDGLQEARPHALPSTASQSQTASPTRQQGDITGTLLLPDHVVVHPTLSSIASGKKQVDVAEGREDWEGDDEWQEDHSDIQGHIGDFTQMDADTSVSRYYEADQAEERKRFKECEICGEKGHVKKECSHMQCASCGAMDEHPTRGCPVGISCFRCGQRGHRAADCRQRPAARGESSCRRCGSTNHTERSCPTYWRIYTYVDEEQWDHFRARKHAALCAEEEQDEEDHHRYRHQGRVKRRRREAPSDMDTDSDDGQSPRSRAERRAGPRHDWDPAVRWCYNCTASGTHWGDDCPLPRRAYTRNGEPSIFSEFISLSGPFAHSLAPPPEPEAVHPVADMYDVSVGPNASMHFFGGGASDASNRPGAGAKGGQQSLEDYVDGVFARAPKSLRGRVERDRREERRGTQKDRQRERDRKRHPETDGVHSRPPERASKIASAPRSRLQEVSIRDKSVNATASISGIAKEDDATSTTKTRSSSSEKVKSGGNHKESRSALPTNASIQKRKAMHKFDIDDDFQCQPHGQVDQSSSSTAVTASSPNAQAPLSTKARSGKLLTTEVSSKGARKRIRRDLLANGYIYQGDQMVSCHGVTMSAGEVRKLEEIARARDEQRVHSAVQPDVTTSKRGSGFDEGGDGSVRKAMATAASLPELPPAPRPVEGFARAAATTGSSQTLGAKSQKQQQQDKTGKEVGKTLRRDVRKELAKQEKTKARAGREKGTAEAESRAGAVTVVGQQDRGKQKPSKQNQNLQQKQDTQQKPLTSRQLQSHRDKALAAQHKASQRGVGPGKGKGEYKGGPQQRPGEAAFGPFSIDDDDDEQQYKEPDHSRSTAGERTTTAARTRRSGRRVKGAEGISVIGEGEEDNDNDDDSDGVNFGTAEEFKRASKRASKKSTSTSKSGSDSRSETQSRRKNVSTVLSSATRAAGAARPRSITNRPLFDGGYD